MDVEIPDFDLHERVHETRRTLVLRGTRIADAQPVVAKIVVGDPLRVRTLARLRNEYQLLASLDSPHVPRALGFHHEPGRHAAIMMVDLGGVSLDQWLDAMPGPLAIEVALTLGIQAAEGLEAIHRAGLIHYDVKPHNLICRRDPWRLQIIDFGLAVRLAIDEPELVHSDLVDTLPYMSPEQTGRMNCPVDHRSDIYSLGVVLYRLLTGTLPYDADDQLGWIHAHIAQRPQPASDHVPDLPDPVVAIVERALAKDSEQRYQSAHGLACDLRRALALLQTRGSITGFELGRDDRSSRFLIPHTLLGREREVASLLAAFRGVGLREASPALVLVSGEPGVGKSALVGALEQPITAQRGLAIRGKFDRQRGSQPLTGVLELFEGLVSKALTLPERELAELRGRLKAALGSSGGVLIEILPSFAQLIDAQPDPPELGAFERLNLIQLVVEWVFGCFARPSAPLALILDDLQWADPASLDLLAHLLGSASVHGLLIVGTYREGELDAEHPLTRMLAELDAAPVPVPCTMIELGPLRPADVAALVEQTLLCSDEHARALAELAWSTTGGNPLFVRQWLGSLYDQGLVEFDAETRSWRWELDRVRAVVVSEDLATLLVRRQALLPAPTFALLQLAACMGARFDLATLAMVAELPPGDCLARLWPALEHGSIVADAGTLLRLHEVDRELPVDDVLLTDLRFRFAHDRVQTNAAAQLPDPARVHLQIARSLLRRLDPEQRAARCFELADQLDAARELIHDARELAELVAINWQCGVRALDAGAHAAAVEYLEIAGAALTDDAAADPQQSWFAIQLERARALFLVGRHADAQALQGPLDAAARTDEQRLALLRLLADQAAVTGDYARGVAVCVQALALLGVDAPASEAAAGPLVEAAIARVEIDRAGRTYAELRVAPSMESEQARAISAVLDDLSVISYLAGQWALNAWTNASIASVSLRYGHASVSGLAYTLFSLLLSIRGDQEHARAYGRLGMALSEAFRDPAVFARATIAYYGLVAHHHQPLSTIIPKLYAAHGIGLEGGDLTGASHTLLFGDSHKLASGAPLAELRAEIDRHLPFFHRADRTSLALFYLPHVVHACAWLLDGDCEALFGLSFDPERFLAESTDVESARGWHISAQTKLDALAGVEVDLDELERRVASVERGLAGQLHVAETRYYAALILIARGRRGRLDAAERARADALVEAWQQALAGWARHCEANFRHKLLLIEAEQLGDRSGAEFVAADRYEQAIASARQFGFLDQEALALRCYGEFCLAKGLGQTGRMQLREALARYAEWGAGRVVRLLVERHAWLNEHESSWPSLHSRASHASTRVARGLDLDTVGRASRAVSSGTTRAELLDSLTEILRRQVAAERCAILLIEAGEVIVAAAHDGAGEPDREPAYARAIVDYVRRSGEFVVVDHAARDSRWSTDEHVQTTQPKSLLCAPIGAGEGVHGVVYAENNLTTRAFRPAQIELLRVVLAQTAISLDNIRLFEAIGVREAHWRSLVENAPDVILTVDRSHVVCFANRRESRFARRPLTGASIRELVGDGDRDLAEAAIDHVFTTGKPTQFETHVERQGGARVLTARLGPMRGADGEVELVTVIARDITEQRQLEAELRHAQKMEAVGRLASGVAHDFNNLLTVMFASAELGAMASEPGSAAHAQFDEVLAAAERAERITRQLLMFSRKQVSSTRVVELGALVGNLAKLLGRVLGEDVELALALDGRACPVLGDPGQLEQVVMNLAVNARDAMPRGGTLTISTRASDPDAVKRTIELRVADQGIGMDAATRERIFEPFFTTKPVGSGTGIGLATVHAVVSAIGGTIAVESELGRGTCFVIELPESSELEEVDAEASTSGSRILSADQRVLLVEDDEPARRSIAAMLTRLGFAVAAAANGRRGLEIARELGVIDLLLTDVVLPEMSGPELAAVLAERDPELVVLYMSGHDAEALRRHGVNPASRAGLLGKPFTFSMLEQAISLAMSQPSSE